MSIDALQEKIRTFKNPSMVGLDPSPEVIPAGVLKNIFPSSGRRPRGFPRLIFISAAISWKFSGRRCPP